MFPFNENDVDDLIKAQLDTKTVAGKDRLIFMIHIVGGMAFGLVGWHVALILVR